MCIYFGDNAFDGGYFDSSLNGPNNFMDEYRNTFSENENFSFYDNIHDKDNEKIVLEKTDSQTDKNNNNLPSHEKFLIEKNEKNKIIDNESNKKINLVHEIRKEKEEIPEERIVKDKLSKQKDTIFPMNNEKKLECINLGEKKGSQGNEGKVVKEKNRFGRKKKNDTKKGKHNKNSNDNIINKIKGGFFYFIRDFIKKHSINNKIELKKIPSEFIANVTKKTNEKLWKMKISEILMNQEISTKYSTLDRYENRKIIEKIYSENKEINVIKILELTFEELFIIFRRKLKDKEDMKKLEEMKDKIEGLDLNEINNKYEDFEWLINGIKKKYDNNLNEDEIRYIKQVENLCLGYEDWFDNKPTRKNQKV